jgi:HEAT repeat protein
MQKYIDLAIQDANPDIRIAGLRAVRQSKLDILDYVEKLAKDTDPQVRRECAIALYGQKILKLTSCGQLWLRNTMAKTVGIWRLWVLVLRQLGCLL